MDDIAARLQETSATCLEAFKSWSGNKKDTKAQGDLAAAIHELRKVSSRLEIELAVSERDQITSKPLPIPSHRSNPRGTKGKAPTVPEDIDDSGSSTLEVKATTTRRRRTPRKAPDAE